MKRHDSSRLLCIGTESLVCRTGLDGDENVVGCRRSSSYCSSVACEGFASCDDCFPRPNEKEFPSSTFACSVSSPGRTVSSLFLQWKHEVQ